jgi:hypothetical protein
MATHPIRRLALATALCLLATGGSTWAQQTTELPSWRTPGWSFTPGLAISGEFDSNIALASPPADTRQTQSDRLIVAEPFAQLEYFSRRTELSTGYRGFLRRYMDVTELNGFDQRGSLSLRRLATKRLTLSFNDAYMHVPTTDDVELNGVPFSRTGARTNRAAAGFDARLTKLTTLGVRYENTWVDFDRRDTVLTGGWVNGVRVNLTRDVTARVSVGGEYGLRFADLNEGTRNLTFQDAGGTLRLLLAPHTALSLAGGYSYLDDRSFDTVRTGPYVRAELTHDVEHATVGASFERSFVPSFGFGGSSQSQEIRGYVRMPLDRNRMYLNGSAAWRRTDPLITSELVLDAIWIRSAIGYSASRWLRIEGFHAFTRQDSRVTGGEINRNRIGVEAVISQPMRIR